MKRKVLGVIPARLGSTRLPEKPLHDICGKPMIQWVYERARRARLIDKLIVATDSRKIARVVEGFGGTAVMTSPDHQSGTDRIAEVALGEKHHDVIINIQGDEPLIMPEMLDYLIEGFLASGEQVGTLIKRIEDSQELEDSSVVKVVVDHNGKALYFSRSPIPFDRDGDGDTIYYKHVGVYIYRREFLVKFHELPQGRLERIEKLEQLRILESGYDIVTFETQYDTVGVDSREDLERVRKLLSN